MISYYLSLLVVVNCVYLILNWDKVRPLETIQKMRTTYRASEQVLESVREPQALGVPAESRRATVLILLDTDL